MARGTDPGCDAALRPRGRAWAAHAGRMWRWRVAGGHADGPRGRPCGAPCGRGFASGGPTGIVGPGK